MTRPVSDDWFDEFANGTGDFLPEAATTAAVTEQYVNGYCDGAARAWAEIEKGGDMTTTRTAEDLFQLRAALDDDGCRIVVRGVAPGNGAGLPLAYLDRPAALGLSLLLGAYADVMPKAAPRAVEPRRKGCLTLVWSA